MKFCFSSLLVFIMFPLSILGQGFFSSDEFSNITNTQYANGIAVADYDNDGDLDVYIVSKDAFDSSNPSTWNRLYQNDGLSFKDVTVASGLHLAQYAEAAASEYGAKMGASWGDCNNDGYPDLFLTNKGKNQLWLNQGDGSFRNISAESGIEGTETGHSSSALWWDYDNDGDLDLYVGSWIDDNSFYRNDGDLKFTDISNETGLNDVGRTWTSIPFDVNKDGLLDLFIVNDFGSSELFINQSNDQFINQTKHYKLNEPGQGMGVDICDYKNDGNFDIYVTNISQLKENPLYINNGNTFDNLGSQLGVSDARWGWGARFFDFDHDTDEDLYVVNERFFETGNLEYNRFFVQYDNGFKESASDFGLSKNTDAKTQEVFDFDGDGDLDILLGNWGDFPVLYRNDENNKGNWVQIKLRGTISNRDAFGTVVKIKTEDEKLQHRLNHGANFLGQSIKPVHFGLGQNEIIKELTIFWPSGKIEKINDLDINRMYTFVEGEQDEAPGETYGTIPDEFDYEDETSENASIARKWNELLLESIRRDYARPTVHARNLFHISIAMYDAWTVYDAEAKPFFLGNTLGNYTCSFDGISIPEDIESARQEAISYASYRLLNHRFKNSPGALVMLNAYKRFMEEELGYDINYTSSDYSSGSSAALGNYIAQELIEFGKNDGANEQNDYENKYYQPNNLPLVVDNPSNPTLVNPNSWQPLTLSTFIDQSGNEIPGSTPDFLSPEWGQVVSFALKEEQASYHVRDGYNYKMFNDPGKPVEIITQGESGLNDPYKWGFAMVSVWSSHLDPEDSVMIDISPGSIGNTKIEEFPKTFEQYKQYYDFYDGGDMGTGHDINPVTGEAYVPQIVPRGDYARVLAEFWADGPDSETPPGHWFTILNYVSDHPLTEKRFSGKGDVMGNLEWDVKSYLTLSGAMHDCAVTAWGIKGYYDYIRPISAIRYMASKGQSTDVSLDNFHPEGIPLIPRYIEVIGSEDPLAGSDHEHIGKIKLFAWKGSHFIDDPDSDVAGVDWILADHWVPYQRPSFVTPPFAGYVSGHSTFSRAAAEVLTQLTGSNFFPGGMGVFDANKNDFLVFEDGPSQDLVLQWATYQDASDQTSLSRIWGGIHPPIDDIPGRLLGEDIGKEAFNLAKQYFYMDADHDGYYSYEDYDDNDSSIHEEGDKRPKLDYSIYPVPVDDLLTLSIDYEGTLTLNTFNIYGRLVTKRDIIIQDNIGQISMKNLTTGTYLILLTNPNGEKLFSRKIVKY